MVLWDLIGLLEIFILQVELLRSRKAIMTEISAQLLSPRDKTLLIKIDKLRNKVSLLRGQLKKRNCHCNYLRLRLGKLW